MITSTPINLKDISDARYVQSSQYPVGLTARLNRRALQAAIDEKNLVAFIAKANGYQKETIWATAVDTPTGKGITFYPFPLIGAYIVDHGRVLGKVRE